LLSSSRKRPCFRFVSSSGIIGSHWKGVNGLGQKVDTPTLISARGWNFFPRRSASAHSCTIARTSSSRSSGRPIMK
jgi:hypothetical protein